MRSIHEKLGVCRVILSCVGCVCVCCVYHEKYEDDLVGAFAVSPVEESVEVEELVCQCLLAMRMRHKLKQDFKKKQFTYDHFK